MAAAETVELLGGSRDGQVLQAPQDLHWIEVAEPIRHYGSLWSELTEPERPGPTLRSVRYLRTNLFNQGRRIYRLEGLDHVR